MHWKSRIWSGNIFVVLFYRILIVLLLFSLCRTAFYLFNYQMFPGISFIQFMNIMRGGLLFDISAAVYLNMIVILLHIVPFDFRYNAKYQEVVKYIFFLVNGTALAANCADFVYYKFVFKRATSDVFATFEHERHLGKMFFSFMADYWPATLWGIFVLFMLVFLYNRVKPEKPSIAAALSSRLVYHAANLVMIPVVIALVIGGARGGYRHSTRPITISNAARFVENPRDVAIVLNTPFSIFRTYGKKTLERYSYFDNVRLKQLYDPHYTPAQGKPFTKENVVIIILESFAREYIGALNRDLEDGHYEGYTPFLDSLISQSLTFDVSIANGKKSIDAMPSILASVPSLETPYIISHYANNKINGLPELLKRKGYYSAFFHGAPNGSMGFDSFARMVGFDDYFGLDQYDKKSDFDGMWGVWDEPFFRFFASKLKTFPQPFLATIFSVSSHHPFKVPAQYENKFRKGPAPIVEVVGYTDFALKNLFKEISSEPWFSNTLFIITADHTNESMHKKFQNNFGSYCIPVIFYKPGSDMKGIKKKIAQQIDIMPSVLSYLNFDEEYIAFGNDLFNDAAESFAFNSNGSTYHLYMNDHLLEMIDGKPVGLYNFKKDIFLNSNLLGKEIDVQQPLEDKLRAIVQTYNSRLLDNKMVVRK